MMHDSEGGRHSYLSRQTNISRDIMRRFLIALILLVPLLAFSPELWKWFLIPPIPFAGSGWVVFGISAIIILYCAQPFYAQARSELRHRAFGMMTLVSIALLVGFIYSTTAMFMRDGGDFYWELSTLAVILLLGRWIEARMVVSSHRSLFELSALIPQQAHTLVNHGSTALVPTESLRVGMFVLIKPGERIPIDGQVVEGTSSVDELLITGESTPVPKQKGDAVIGGSLNRDGALTVEVSKTGKDTAIAHIIEMVGSALQSKPSIQRMAERAAGYLTLIGIAAGVATFFIWNAWIGLTVFSALTIAMTVVLTTCPQALGQAVPAVAAVTSSLAARKGILIKNMAALERARRVEWVLFDKTGTLTEGVFGVSDVISIDEDERMVLAVAASVEAKSDHAIGISIVNKCKEKKITTYPISNFKTTPGHGVSATVHCDEMLNVCIGTKEFLNYCDTTLDDSVLALAARLANEGKTVIYVGWNGRLKGVLALSDEVKPGAYHAVYALKRMGKKIALITGDNEKAASFVAKRLAIDKYYAQVVPSKKAEKVAKLQQEGKGVMMVGDGINDAPALMRADVGIAQGVNGNGSEASASIILVKNDPADIAQLLLLAEKARAKMRQNLYWAAGYNIIALPIAAGVLAPWGVLLEPQWGAIAMTLASIAVVGNALMLKRATFTLEQ